MVLVIPLRVGAVRELEGSADVQHFQTMATPALSLEKPLEKELNTSVLDGHLCLNIPEFCQDLGMLRKLTIQTTSLDLRCLCKVENGKVKWPKLCWSLHMVEKLHQEASRLLTPTLGSCLRTVAASSGKGTRGCALLGEGRL